MFKSALFGMLAVYLLIKIASAGHDFGRYLARAVDKPGPADASQTQRPSRELAIKLVV